MANYSLNDIKDKFGNVYKSYFDFRETGDKGKEGYYLKAEKELEDIINDHLNTNIPNPTSAEKFFIDIVKDSKSLNTIFDGEYNLDKGNWKKLLPIGTIKWILNKKP